MTTTWHRLIPVVWLTACHPTLPAEPRPTPPPVPLPVLDFFTPNPLIPVGEPEQSPKPTPQSINPPAQSPKPRPATGRYAWQSTLWYSAKLRPDWIGRLDKVISRSLLYRQRYEQIEGMRDNGVPWFVVAGLHERESSQSFARHLHEGSPLTGRTRYVPAGRIPHIAPPYTFEQSAEDALYVLKDMDSTRWDDLNESLQRIEAYNGLGYQKYHRDVSSPYLWSGTSHHSRGKYTSDGKFSHTAIEQQIGVAALILLMNERGITSYFPQDKTTNPLHTNQ